MNSYFASVEQQANPHLRGRPLGVCAYLHNNGCVIAASVEAKKLGVKVGMTLREAREQCPETAFVQNDPPKYRAVTSRVFAILHELTDKVEHYSIDEAFLDLTGWYRDAAEAAWALGRAKLRIQSEVGEWLRCSVGIAPSKFLSKLASDLQKPNGLVILDESNLDEWLGKLELEDAWGIGKHIRRRLNRLGIFTLLDLKRHPVGNLMRALGKAGWQWHERLHGRDVDRMELVGARPPKSVGHSFCVPRRSRTTWRADEPARILAILLRLTERAGRRMRSYGLLARAMDVQIGFRETENPPAPLSQGGVLDAKSPLVKGDLGDFRAAEGGLSVAFAEPADDVFTLAEAATRLFASMWRDESVSFLAVTLMDLVPWSGQGCLSLYNPVIPDMPALAPLRSPLEVSAVEGIGDPENRVNNPIGINWKKGMDSRFLAFNAIHGNDRVERRRETSQAVDRIRDRYGDESIVFASMLGLSSDYAPDRIGFRKTEGVDV